MMTVTYDETSWKLVPVEPTEDMVRASVAAAAGYSQEGRNKLIYSSMIRVAPPSPQLVADSVDDRPVAEVAEDFVFMLRKQPDGERWPVGTKLYTHPAAPPSPQPVAESDGLKQAADYIDRQAESYMQENARADYDTGATVWENDECRDHYYAITELADEIRNLTPAAALQPVAGLTDAEISYELVQDDMVVAGASGPGAEREMRHYAAVYGQNGPVECFKVERTPFAFTGQSGATGESNDA